MVGEVCEVFVVRMVGEVCEVFVVCMVGEVYDATKSENGGVLTSRFRGEEYLFCQSRGRDDVKLVEKVSKSSSFATIGQVQVEISSFASRVRRTRFSGFFFLYSCIAGFFFLKSETRTSVASVSPPPPSQTNQPKPNHVWGKD